MSHAPYAAESRPGDAAQQDIPGRRPRDGRAVGKGWR